MNSTLVHRDERTEAVENASYRWAYLFVSFGLLLLVAYRSFAREEAPWDLLALVILGGLISSAYQGLHKVLNKRWALVTAATMLIAAILAAVIALLR